MKTRPITWGDVNAEISTRYAGINKPRVPWRNTYNGKVRVYARLKLCAFVSYELWVENPDLNNPALQAMIILQLHKRLRWTVHRLKAFEIV